MGRKKRNLPLLEKVLFTDTGESGKAVGRAGEKVVFAKGAIPGDVADVQVFRKKSSFFEGSVTQIHEYSEFRTEPFCKHFELCGGCSWQNMQYETQANFKEKKAKDALQRLGHVEAQKWNSILKAPAIVHHRNKLEYTFSQSRWLTEEEIKTDLDFENRLGLGFHLPGKFDKVLHIEECHLQDLRTNDIRNFIFKKSLELEISFFHLRNQEGVLRNLIVRNTNQEEWMLVLSITEFSEKIENLLNQIKIEFPFITSLFYVINTKKNDTIGDLTPVLFSGKDHILEIFENPLNQKIKYRIGPKSFFQTNSNQAQELYRLAFNLAQPKANETMYDLYTGTGSIALFFANAVKKVVGVEYVEEAIEDAKINAQLNNIENVSFFAGDMKDIFTEDFIAANGTPDLVVTDPPRAGMHADVVAQLAKLKPTRILYISCNPATQARDLIELTPFYDVIESQAVDMFPHTNHVENITLLHLKA